MSGSTTFGCNACFQEDAEKAWEARRGFSVIKRLVEESHFLVTILACPKCGQRSVNVFTETVDWQGGDDPQYWSVLPLTTEESEQLIAQGENVDLRLIETFGRNRRYLQRDYPKGEDPRVCWGSGHLMIGYHD